jgi:hypothetical protein
MFVTFVDTWLVRLHTYFVSHPFRLHCATEFELPRLPKPFFKGNLVIAQPLITNATNVISF